MPYAACANCDTHSVLVLHVSPGLTASQPHSVTHTGTPGMLASRQASMLWRPAASTTSQDKAGQARLLATYAVYITSLAGPPQVSPCCHITHACHDTYACLASSNCDPMQATVKGTAVVLCMLVRVLQGRLCRTHRSCCCLGALGGRQPVSLWRC